MEGFAQEPIELALSHGLCSVDGSHLLICVKCGSHNPQGYLFCLSCNAPLPKIDETEMMVLHEEVTERYIAIENQCSKARTGEISMEEFYDYIARTLNILAVKGQEIMELVEESNYREDSPQEIDVGYQGMGLYEEGLRTLLLFADDGNNGHIDEGLETIKRGNDLINQAMTFNRKARLELQWGYL
jgi:hypothetical protein